MKANVRSVFSNRYVWLIVLLLGVVIIGAVFSASTRSDMQATEERLSDTVNYIRKQCSTYSSLNLASETKSLIRVAECAQQVSRNLTFDCESYGTDSERLERYAGQLFLSGVILLTSDGELVGEYNNDGVGFEGLSPELEKTVALDVAEHPEKSYMARADMPDGTYIDFASFGRTDTEGVVVAYYHTPEEYIASYSLSFQNLLSGYSMENDGTIAVTEGDVVIASNDESIIGQSTDDIAILRNIRSRAVNGKMVHVRSGAGLTNQSFGVVDRGRDYYVYAYRTERSVFESTPRKLLIAAIAYAFALLLLQLVGWKTAQNYRDAQLAQEKAYQEKLKESARKAESANVAKTEFLQRMSHDIRTPINGIRGMVEIGNHYKDDPVKQAECRRKIYEASGLLLELVNEVLDMGKLESGEIVLEERGFDMDKLLDEICDTVERTAAERGVTIIKSGRCLPHRHLTGSPLHIKRLIMNIISNAVKYNRENGTVTVSCRELSCSGDDVVIEFICADTGIGMSEEFQKHIFEPFTQENISARSTYGGTGLGMSIAKSLAEKMGGTLSFESKQGVGTTFRITLPLKIDNEAEQSALQPAPEENVDISGASVLVAEDNELNMEIAVFILENAGARVTSAHDGDEAVRLFKDSKPGEFDAILMDVMMPGTDGYQATRIIRAMDRPDAKTVPIIAMTANAFPEDRQKAREAGMTEHLTKPLESQPLLKALKKYMKR